MKFLGAAFMLMIVMACSDTSTRQPVVQVEPRDHTFIIRARGELIASESITIRLPDDVLMRFNIAWMVPEYSEVSRGEVIIRFDDSEVLSSREYSILEVATQDLHLETHSRNSAVARTMIDHEASRVDEEKDIAQNFVGVDPRLFSRNEIIDKLGDLDFLEVQNTYFTWQAETHDQRSDAERHRISASRDASQSKLDKQNSALAVIELTSPADGTFVYARTPWGQKLSRGQRAFAGRPVGMLPLRGKVRARIFVPEVDAIGLEVGLDVVMRLDSDVGREFTARVSTVSPVATPRRREDPQKYFVVEADFDEVDADLMRVGSNLTAVITTATINDAFLLPQQAVFFEEDASFVYVLDGSAQVAREVSLGHRSPTLVEVTSGLTSGELVSVAPEGGNS